MTILCLESWYFGQIKEVKTTLKEKMRVKQKEDREMAFYSREVNMI